MKVEHSFLVRQSFIFRAISISLVSNYMEFIIHNSSISTQFFDFRSLVVQSAVLRYSVNTYKELLRREGGDKRLLLLK